MATPFDTWIFPDEPTEREQAHSVEQAEATAAWFFNLVTKRQKAEFDATMDVLRGTVGPRWSRERAKAYSKWTAETKAAERLYHETVECLLSTGEVSDELDEMWTALIDAAEGRNEEDAA